MGLDMYLTAQRHAWTYEKAPRITGIPKGFEMSSIRVNAAYWRKANAIHNWFVVNVQKGVDDCGEYDVAFEQLIELRDICSRVLADYSLAPTLLPSKSGFFFGSTEYASWYFEDLKDTVDQINKIVKAFDKKKWHLVYQASW